MKKFIALFIFLSFQSQAEIVKKAFICEKTNGFCLMSWPKLPQISGWHQDLGKSRHYKMNAQAVDGFTFSDSEVVIYANAEYQHEQMPYKTLKEFISYSQSQFTSGSYPVTIEKSDVLKSSTGITFYTYHFKPQSQGDWEHVSYAEETDNDGNKYYLIFTLSSRTESGYKTYLTDYFKFIKLYS